MQNLSCGHDGLEGCFLMLKTVNGIQSLGWHWALVDAEIRVLRWQRAPSWDTVVTLRQFPALVWTVWTWGRCGNKVGHRLSPGPCSEVEKLLDNGRCLLHTAWAPQPLIKGSKSPGERLPNESLPPIAGHWCFRQTFVYILTSDTIKNGMLDLLTAKVPREAEQGNSQVILKRSPLNSAQGGVQKVLH